MLKSLFLSMAIFVLFYVISCGNTSGSGATSPVAQISLSYPSILFGATTLSATDTKSLTSQKTDFSSGTTYYLPISNPSRTAISVTSTVIETNSEVWTTTASDKCVKGISMDSCNLIITFNADAVKNLSQLSSILKVTFSNGAIFQVPLNGQTVTSKTLVMQATNHIVTNSFGKSYGVITAFNNTTNPVLINESEIFVSNGDKWNFKVNCNGAESKIIMPGSGCSIGFVSDSIVSIPTIIQISIPVVNQASPTSGSNSQTVIASTTLVPFQSTPAPYLAYLNGTVFATGETAVTFPLLNLGTGNLNGITIDGLPKNMIQSNNCINVAPNGLCNVNLDVIQGVIPPVTTLQIHADNQAGRNIQQVSIAQQALIVSPLFINFGPAFSGTVVQKNVMINNLSASTINYQIGTITNPAFTVESGNCTNDTLPSLESCTFQVIFTAEQVTESEVANLVISDNNSQESPQIMSLNAKSISAPAWTNIITSGGYTDSGSIVSALIANIDGTSLITFANSAKHVWQLSDSAIWVNISGNFIDYYNQTISAFGLAFTNFFVGGYIDGSVAVCGAIPGQCIQSLAPQLPFAVTSEINVTEYRGMVSFGSADGTTGQLLTADGSTFPPVPVAIPGITSGVGRMATDGVFGNANALYAPLSNGQIVEINAPWTAVTKDITPDNFASGEYAIVMFYDLNTNQLYAGTNLANVYMSSKPIGKTSWVKLTDTRLSGTSYISSIAANSNSDIYVGLSTSGNKTLGGGLYIMPHDEDTFIAASPSYSDTSTITNIVFDARITQHMYIGTYSGNIWQQ